MGVSFLGKQPNNINLLNAAPQRYEHRIILAGNYDIAFRPRYVS